MPRCGLGTAPTVVYLHLVRPHLVQSGTRSDYIHTPETCASQSFGRLARLAGVVPITPGGMGTIDSAFIGMLAAFGTSASRALAADVVWRLATYVAPILLGILTYLIWIRREHRLGAKKKVRVAVKG